MDDPPLIMRQPQRLPDSDQDKNQNSANAEERRSHRREDSVISRIEDVTYKVLRQHEPKKA